MARRKFDIAKARKNISESANRRIDEAIAKGGTKQDIKQAIKKEVQRSKNISLTIARTESTRASGEYREEAYSEMWELGVEVIKVWMHMDIAKEPRQNHIAMDGEEAFPNEPFSNGLMYPADPDGEPSEIYNCHCRTRPEILNLSALNKVKALAKSRDMNVSKKNINRLIDESLELARQGKGANK